MTFFDNKIKNIAGLLVLAMFFSCVNSVKEVNDFLADQNLPVGEVTTLNHVYRDSGMVTLRVKSPLMLDFSNREENPYQYFPKGLSLLSIKSDRTDSTSVSGNEAYMYNKTNISELIGEVKIYNFTQKALLETSQLYWDQKINYLFTSNKFKLTTASDTIYGEGFESSLNLKHWLMKEVSGDLIIKENKE